jgi:hypothetical protein
MRIKSFILSVLIVLVILYSFSIFMEYRYSRYDRICNSMRQEFRQTEFAGRVKSKYLDEKNHLIPTIQVGNSSFKFFWKYMDLYDRVKVGDSLIKENGNEFIILITESGMEKIELRVNCNDFKREFSWKNTLNFLYYFFPRRE